MITLGIETSCDETALSLIETQTSRTTDGSQIECRVIDSLVHSQAELHSAYGGVYPNLAKREHGKNLAPLLHKLLINSGDALKALSQSGSPVKEISRDKFIEILENERSIINQFIIENTDKLIKWFPKCACHIIELNTNFYNIQHINSNILSYNFDGIIINPL